MVDLFLQAGDLLKYHLALHKDGREFDSNGRAELCERLKQLIEDAENDTREDPGSRGDGKDPGYGFFEEIHPAEEADLIAGIERRSSENSGRRVLDNPDVGLPQTGRRASDKTVGAAQLDAASIRVNVKKVDQLINQVGELVITQAMLAQTAAQIDPVAYERLQNGLEQLERNTRDLQESVMCVRMMPIGIAFSRFPRLVRDMAGKLNKEVELRMIGEETELDKGLIEQLVDPLTHLVRNSLDHGIESPDQRIAAGKDPKGVITLHASHQGGNVIVEVSDDGAGLDRERILKKALERGLPVTEAMSDEEVWQLIFAPGFSTAEVVTDVSGRGVGMDVVKRNVQAMGGRVEIQSERGRGSKFIIQLPLTLAIIEGMVVRVGCEVYIMPLISIIESIRPKRSDVKTIVGKGEVVKVRSDYVKIARLYHLFGIRSELTDPAQAVLVITESTGEQAAIMVDELLGKQQVVIKGLEENFQKVEGVAGATILGDGQVALILDVRGLLSLAREEKGIRASV